MIEFHPEAIAEARAARRWYKKKDERIADAFQKEIDQYNMGQYWKYQRALEEYERGTLHYQTALLNWNKAYYCRRDDVVYISDDSSRAVSPDRMNEIL